MRIRMRKWMLCCFVLAAPLVMGFYFVGVTGRSEKLFQISLGVTGAYLLAILVMLSWSLARSIWEQK